MKCNKVRDILLTDYIDGELDRETSSRVEEHLSGCAACRTFYETVKARTEAPFRDAEDIKPPEGLWERIEAEISRQNAPLQRPDLAEVLSSIFSLKKPVLAAVSILVLIAVFFGGSRYMQYRNYNLAKDYLDQQVSYLLGADENGENGNGFGTSIEEYFLQ